MTESTRLVSRRHTLAMLLAAGPGAAAFGRAIESLAAESRPVTTRMIREAEWISGLSFTDADRKLMLKGIRDAVADYAKIRAVPIDNGVPPAFHFSATPGENPGAPKPHAEARRDSGGMPDLPRRESELAFAPVATLAKWLQTGRVSSVELTKLYLARLRKFDPQLLCTVNLTEERALRQARQADDEIAAGRWRGLLQGVPWGAKDLLAVPGYPTTWGATPYKDQLRPETSAVVERLDAAGAVLVAKLAVGALAWGDVWFGGTTKNPWKLDQGSSGSSAGSASATSAGLVAFGIGTETWGSIVSPCSRCGVTGLRPTFGRVSRHGVMALSWTMDKVGPIARSAEDCALIFGAIHGSDPRDPASVSREFAWPWVGDPRELRIGYVSKLFHEDRTVGAETESDKQSARDSQQNDLRTLETLRALGFRLIQLDVESAYPVGGIALILVAEAAAAFDELTRSGKDDTLERQVEDAWPNVFRQGQLVPAVEYLRASRIRTLVQAEPVQQLSGVDVWLAPSFGGDILLRTNLSGHPCVVTPNGLRSSDGTPTSITFLGQPHREAEMLAVAHAYQDATDAHLARPKGDWLTA